MTEGEQFKQSRRIFSKLIAVAAGFPHSLFAKDAMSIPRIPVVLKWDIRPANSQIEQDFLVTEFRNYYIYIAFNKGGPFDVNELRKFTGDSVFQIVTTGSDPKLVIPKTAEERSRARKLIQEGVYEYQHAHLGIVMPVHLRLEKLDIDGGKTATTMVDETFNTDRENFGLDRAITVVALKPGEYHISLKTLKETYLPHGAESSLVIAYMPKTRVLKDK